MAIPRLPVLSGVLARMARPALVVGLGLAITVAPTFSISARRYGFCW